MKYLLLFLFLSQLFLTCNNPEPEKKKKIVKSEAVILQEGITSIENKLKHEYEKINLLAEFRNIHFDTLKLIIRDYLVFTSSYYDKEKTYEEKYKSSISKLNLRYKYSKSNLASLIFSYKFEMITTDEIEESAVEYFLENYEDHEEINDQNEYF